MTPRLGHGTITGGGPAVKVGAALLPLPATKTPLGAWIARAIARAIADIDSGAIQPCLNCGRYVCECWEWVELMTAPPPADPFDLTSDDIPF